VSEERGNEREDSHAPVGRLASHTCSQSIGVQSRLKSGNRFFMVLTEYDGVFELNEGMSDVIEVE
jgi:hypothetical protein